MAKREFVTAVLEVANSIVRDTYGEVRPAEVRSACSLASVAPPPDDANAASSKKRQRGCDHRQGYLGMGSDRSVDDWLSCPRDMAPFYRAVLYPQDGNQDAGGLAFSLVHMADEDPNPRTPEVQTLAHLLSLYRWKSEEGDRRLSMFLRKELVPPNNKPQGCPVLETCHGQRADAGTCTWAEDKGF
jgi:hypothetical protein